MILNNSKEDRKRLERIEKSQIAKKGVSSARLFLSSGRPPSGGGSRPRPRPPAAPTPAAPGQSGRARREEQENKRGRRGEQPLL